MGTLSVSKLPDWLPEDAQRYLQHTETGQSIRQLARQAGCHPSTVLRQVRRIETRRDDPLIDSILTALACCHSGAEESGALPPSQTALLEARSVEILTRLAQHGAVLAVAEGMETAVVVRQGDPVEAKLSVSRGLAGAMALLTWIDCTRSGRLSRYQITSNGRNLLTRLVAERENKARNRAENGIAALAGGPSGHKGQSPRPRRTRYGSGETPMDMLARLIDKNGQPFLPPDLVQVGKRLREDFEVAQIGNHLMQEAAYFGGESCARPEPAPMPSATARAARDRARRALAALGAGLSDIALRCCCYLEGLEAAERQLGWSARSGKIVLRIALQQLQSHYESCGQEGEQEKLIG